MHIKISKSSLSEALNSVQNVVAKTTLQVLNNVKVEAADGKVEFTCSDLDITLLARAECEVVEPGATTIPVKTLASAVSKVVDCTIDLIVDPTTDKATLSAGNTVFKFVGIAAKEFPSAPTAEGAGATVSSAAIREMLRKTSFAVSQDETRRTLQSVMLDFDEGAGNVKAVATDGRRLALLEGSIEGAKGFKGQYLLPRKAVDILLKRLPKEGDCTIVTSKSQIFFKTEKIDFMMKLVDDIFPNYGQVIPKSTKFSIPMDRVDLIGAIDRISVFALMTDAPCVALAFANNKCMISSGDTEYGDAKDEIPVKYEGEEITMRFNPQYIRDVLNVIDEDEVEIFLSDSSKPAIFRKAGSNDYTYVVMPLRTR